MQELVEAINDAELVLVGIGEEFELPEAEESHNYQEEYERRKAAYRVLEGLIRDKNYFCVTLCQDQLLLEAGLKEHRIVDPCGSLMRFQCPDKCTEEILLPAEELKKELQNALKEGKLKACSEKLPICPKCGKRTVFNLVSNRNYNEQGYLDQWSLYTKWLQGTVNKRICILELGVGMRYPTVIRWPFEKITFFNQKASMYRVHSRLFQITEEIKDRCCGIEENSVVFLNELSNETEYVKL